MPVTVSFHDFIVFPFAERHHDGMMESLLRRAGPVLLVGGGAVDPGRLARAARDAAGVAAADSGADTLLAAGIVPDAVIGDMDSISGAARAALPPGVLHEIAEQDSTDFDKALRHIEAPLVIGHGFLGARMDHALAVLSVLARYPERTCLLEGPEDAVALLPPEITLDLAPGTRVSLWPLGPVTGRSEGLRWPIDGLSFAPDATVGTSNEATGPVRLRIDAPRMLVILPVAEAEALRHGLAARPATWPARAG